MKRAAVALCGVLTLVGWPLVADEAPPAETEAIDWNRARALFQRDQRGETLTPEERAYLDRARQLRQQGQGQRPRPALEPRPSVGLKPLTDMGADERYKDQPGGLYGEGRNVPPAEHLALALQAAAEVRPRDAAGQPDPAGLIGLLSVGMSNTTQEFSTFVQGANADPLKSPAVRLVDGAQGGQTTVEWITPDDRRQPGRPPVWEVVEQRLRQAGVSAAQVQVAWVKQARRQPAGLGEFPAHTDALAADLAVLLPLLRERFPNLRLAYLSSRTYAGWATGDLNPEPYAYESAFAVRQVIAGQLAGRPELNADPARGEVKAPVLLWGPYLWTDGETPRADGLTWLRADCAADGTHPSPSGRQKVGRLLLDFFKTDPTASPWFRVPEPPQP